jgi:DNA ligase (NAD+)
MSKDLISKDYLKKIELIEKYNKYYHDKGKPIVSDQEFDLLKKEIIYLESKHKFLQSEKSPTKTVGFKPSKNFQKSKHKVPMLSLGNAFDEMDLINFEKKNS